MMAQMNVLLLSNDPLTTQSNPALNDLAHVPITLKERDLPNVRRHRYNRPTLAQQLRSNYINAKFNTAESQILRKKSRENIRKNSSGTISTRRKKSDDSVSKKTAKSESRVRKNSNFGKSNKNTGRQSAKSDNARQVEKDGRPETTESIRSGNQGYLTHRGIEGVQLVGYNPYSLNQKENTLPADFVLDGNGIAGVQWSRYNSPQKAPKSMSTKTTIETKTYQKNGKWYEDEIKTVTLTDGGNSKTTTTTTTTEIDPFSPDNLPQTPEYIEEQRPKSTLVTPAIPATPASQSQEKEKKGLIDRLTDGLSSDSDHEDEDDKKFAKKVLKYTNEKRKLHKVKELKLSKELMESSKTWAEKIAKDDQMAHNPSRKFGENIYCVSSTVKGFHVDAVKVVDSWYKEIDQHDFNKEPEGGILKSGHFSQLIWKDTTEMGIHKARSKDGLKMYVVANYAPKGNWIGEFNSQVPPVGGFPKSSKPATSAKKPSSPDVVSSGDSSSEEHDFDGDILKAHNAYRAKHGVKPLKYDKKLSKFAQEWADTIAKKERMEHRPNNKYGENIFMKWSSNPNHKVKGSEAVDSWYSEIKFFAFGQEPTGLEAGHFTQVIWAKSETLGVGVGRAKSGKIYVVANYDPPGNFVGTFAANVPPPK